MSRLRENQTQALDAPAAEPTFEVIRRFVVVRGVRRPLRLVRFARGWVASVETESGPSVGADHSPYLAARRALEPLGVDLIDTLTLLGPMPRG